GENTNAFALVDAAVEQVPQLGALILRLPLAELIAEGEDAFLGPGLLFVTTGATEGRVESPLRESIEQSSSLQKAAAFLSSQAERAGSFFNGLAVGMDDQARPEVRAEAVAKLDHLAELVGRVDVEQRKRDFSRIERLLCQADHHGRILPD